MRRCFLVFTVLFLMTGCMGKYEYMLRKANADNQARHPATYNALTIKGPVDIKDGAELVVSAPTQPFVPIDVPDGMARQAETAKTAIGAALVGYGINRIGDSGDTKIINNGGNP